MKFPISGIVAPAVAALCLAAVCSGEDAKESAVVEAAKAVVEKHKDAVVEVHLVLKTQQAFGGREGRNYEQKVEANGTVIDPSGLTVISNIGIDPTARFSMNRREDEPQMDLATLITDTKIVLADGKEYPAEVVLRDKDLDLAFVRPKESGLQLPSVEIKAPPSEPQLLDEVILLTRLDRSANREPAVSVLRLISIIRKPRTQYVAESLQETGCPVFDARGNLLGICLMRIGGSKDYGNGFSMLSTRPAVLPCEDILEAARQAPPVRKDKKADAPGR
jgi:hypothetical protein